MAASTNKQTGSNSRKAGPGRPKGSVNRTTGLLKDAILLAAAEAGGKEGLTGYLKQQATNNPAPFLALLGKVLPLQISGENGGPVKMQVSWLTEAEAAKRGWA